MNRVTNGYSAASVDLNFGGQGDMSFSITSFVSSFGLTRQQYDYAAAFGYAGAAPGAYGSALLLQNLGYSLLRLTASSRNIDLNRGASTTMPQAHRTALADRVCAEFDFIDAWSSPGA